MFFILRMVFWIAVVALLLPGSPGQHQQNVSSSAAAGSLAERAVTAALSYCTASPDKCASGLEDARKLGALLSGKMEAGGNTASIALQHLVALPPPRPAIP